jgi:hypothetical protein
MPKLVLDLHELVHYEFRNQTSHLAGNPLLYNISLDLLKVAYIFKAAAPRRAVLDRAQPQPDQRTEALGTQAARHQTAAPLLGAGWGVLPGIANAELVMPLRLWLITRSGTAEMAREPVF